MSGKEVQSQSADFGSPHYRRIQYLTETMMSEIWLAQRQDGSQVIAKFAIVDEMKLAAKMRMNSDKNDLPNIERFMQQQAEMVRNFLENNRGAIHARIVANQQAIRNEAEQWRALQSPGHPGIVQLYPVNEGSGAAPEYFGQSTLPGNPNYLLVEYLRGGSLRTLVAKEKKLTVERATEMLQITGEILAYIHDRRFAHLDIKPSNIVFRHPPSSKTSLRQAEPILIDFGIAGRIGMPGGESRSDHWSEKSRVVRTDAKGRPIIHQGMDIYSLGLMVRYMLTGKYPPPISEVKDLSQVYPPLKMDDLSFAAKLPKAARRQIVDEFNTFGELCLVDQREKRPTTAQIARLAGYVQNAIAQPLRPPVRQGAFWVTAGMLIGLVLLAAIFFVPGLGVAPTDPTSVASPTATSVAASVAAADPSPTPTEMSTAPPQETDAPAAAPTATPQAEATSTDPPAETVASPPATERARPSSTEATAPTAEPTAEPTSPPTTPPTSTPLPTAAATEVPTATSAPTRPPTPVPTRPAITPTPQFTYATVTELRNESGSMCGSTWQFKVNLSWTVDARYTLPPGYGYDLVVWTPDKPGENPFTTPGITNASRNTSVELDVQSLTAQNRNPQLMHAIGVMLVRLPTATTGYERLHFMGPANCTFRFQAGGSQSMRIPQEGHNTQ